MHIYRNVIFISVCMCMSVHSSVFVCVCVCESVCASVCGRGGGWCLADKREPFALRRSWMTILPGRPGLRLQTAALTSARLRDLDEPLFRASRAWTCSMLKSQEMTRRGKQTIRSALIFKVQSPVLVKGC